MIRRSTDAHKSERTRSQADHRYRIRRSSSLLDLPGTADLVATETSRNVKDQQVERFKKKKNKNCENLQMLLVALSILLASRKKRIFLPYAAGERLCERWKRTVVIGVYALRTRVNEQQDRFLCGSQTGALQ